MGCCESERARAGVKRIQRGYKEVGACEVSPREPWRPMMASDVGVSGETTLLGACASDVLFMWD